MAAAIVSVVLIGSATAASERAGVVRPGHLTEAAPHPATGSHGARSEAVVAYRPNKRVAALRRHIAAKHQATLRHTRLLGRPAWPTRHRWRTSSSIPYLRFLARRWTVRARTAWLVVVAVREPEAAIRFVFGRYAEQALTVARCESGLSVWASNGRYQGLFQVSDHWRRTIPGWGPTALEQARHAFGVFKATGYSWSHWQCSEHGGLRW